MMYRLPQLRTVKPASLLLLPQRKAAIPNVKLWHVLFSVEYLLVPHDKISYLMSAYLGLKQYPVSARLDKLFIAILGTGLLSHYFRNRLLSLQPSTAQKAAVICLY
jgi:hypothetical protein